MSTRPVFGKGRRPRPRRDERPAQIAVIGARPVESLLTHHPERAKKILFSGQLTGARGRLVARAQDLGVETLEVKGLVLEEHAGGAQHNGIVALAESADYVDFEGLLPNPDALLVALDQVTDPRNFGAILRTAEAVGGTGALVTKNRCARLSPTASKTSAGASELLPVAMETNLVRALKAAKSAGLQIIAADLDGVSPWAIDWTLPTVLVIGAEGGGVRPSTRAVCDFIATIPLVGRTESLNAASAASILLYEAARQRATKPA